MSNEAKLADRIAYLEIELAQYRNGTQINTIIIDDAYITENISLRSENQALRDELIAAREAIDDIADRFGFSAALKALSRLDKFLNKGEGK